MLLLRYLLLDFAVFVLAVRFVKLNCKTLTDLHFLANNIWWKNISQSWLQHLISVSHMKFDFMRNIVVIYDVILAIWHWGQTVQTVSEFIMSPGDVFVLNS
jgi:hypothetical protein